MKESDMKNTSETDWDMIDSLTDETIDRTELPPLDESFFARAKWRIPEKSESVTLHIESELLEWFKSHGSEYEQLMIAALRIYAQAHKDITFQHVRQADYEKGQ
ncbi:MAG: hypothetical protein BWK80_20435 [Desulfobacteraceae bacterium IS3]|nr:MAG: hypothetical protein BWK80_20435 [Desulfobacteraceae bacterium IS3]